MKLNAIYWPLNTSNRGGSYTMEAVPYTWINTIIHNEQKATLQYQGLQNVCLGISYNRLLKIPWKPNPGKEFYIMHLIIWTAKSLFYFNIMKQTKT